MSDKPIPGWKLATVGAATFGLLWIAILARVPVGAIVAAAILATWIGVPTFVIGVVRLVKSAILKGQA